MIFLSKNHLLSVNLLMLLLSLLLVSLLSTMVSCISTTPPPSPAVSQNFLNHNYINATVSPTSVGAHRTIMDALSAAPTNSIIPYIIRVMAGSYKELVTVWKNQTNIWLIGDGALVTKITMNRRSSPLMHTRDTSTFSVFGDGFVAKFISFENSAGPGAPALAFLVENSRSAYYKCNFHCYQDTLYVGRGNQFFRECNVYGAVDFIFGDAMSIFQTCNIFALQSNPIYFTAEGKDDANGKTAFVFQNCTFTVAPEVGSRQPQFTAYLGRPWRNYSAVVIFESYLGGIINPAGWAEWPGHSTSLLAYREYKNYGPGADTSKRVKWAGYKALTQSNEVKKYTVKEFIQGDTWIPATGIPYALGFIIA